MNSESRETNKVIEDARQQIFICPCGRKAMIEEMEALKKKETWDMSI